VPPEIENLEKCKKALPSFDVFSSLDFSLQGHSSSNQRITGS